VRSLDRADLYIVARGLADQGYALLARRGLLNPSDPNSFGNLEGYVRHELERGVRAYIKNRPKSVPLVPAGNPSANRPDHDGEMSGNTWESALNPRSQRELDNPVIGWGLTVEQMLTTLELERMLDHMEQDHYQTLRSLIDEGNYRAAAKMLGLRESTLRELLREARLNAMRWFLDAMEVPEPGPWPDGRDRAWRESRQELLALFDRADERRKHLGVS